MLIKLSDTLIVNETEILRIERSEEVDDSGDSTINVTYKRGSGLYNETITDHGGVLWQLICDQVYDELECDGDLGGFVGPILDIKLQ